MDVSELPAPLGGITTDEEPDLNSLVSPCKKLKLGPPLLCSTLLQTPDAKPLSRKTVKNSSAPLCCSTPLPAHTNKTNVRNSGVGAVDEGEPLEDRTVCGDSDKNSEPAEIPELLRETEKSVDTNTNDPNDSDLNDTLKETNSNSNCEQGNTDIEACKIGKDFSEHLLDTWNLKAEANGFIEADKEKNQRLEGSLEFQDSGVCFQESIKENEPASVVKVTSCKGLSVRDPNIIREVEKPVNRNVIIDTYMAKENIIINEDHLPVPKATRKKVKKFIEYTGPGFTATLKPEDLAPTTEDTISKDNDIRTCMLQEYRGPGLTSHPAGKVIDSTEKPCAVDDCNNMFASKIPKGPGIFIDNIPVQESAKATVFQVLKDYNRMTNTSSQSVSEQQTSGSTLRQFSSASSSALKPDEAYPSWTSSKGENNGSKGDNNSSTEKTVSHKVLQCQGMFASM